MMAQDDGQRWVKVEFYGLLPSGQAVTAVDHLGISANLMRVFGFASVDMLTVSAVTAEPSEEDKIRDAMTEATDHPGRIVTR